MAVEPLLRVAGPAVATEVLALSAAAAPEVRGRLHTLALAGPAARSLGGKVTVSQGGCIALL